MYSSILVALENSPTDNVILEYVRPLARLTNASLILTHVADGHVARNLDQLNLGESEEIRRDRAYLEELRRLFESEGFTVSAILAFGDPPKQLVEVAERSQCDLIAMSTHGHRFVGDLIFGSVASAVRHLTDIPVLMVPARKHQRTPAP
jgi:nucleotide-binding universal stress UspA family protein